MADRLNKSRSDTLNDSNTAAVGDTIRAGRRAPTFVMTPEWVIVAGLTPQAQALYTTLLAHVNRQRGDGIAWPGMDALAELLGYKRRQSVRPYLDELADVGAIDIKVRPSRTGRHNVYVVHEVPPAEYAGVVSLAEHYAARRARRGSGALAHHGSDGQAPDGSGAVATMNHTNGTRRSDPDEATSSDAASGAPRTSSQGDGDEPAVRIFFPRGFKRWDDGRAFQYLVKAAVATMREVGKEPAPDAADRIGHALKVSAEDHDVDRDRLVALLEGTIRLAGTDNATWGSLATIRRAS